MVETSIPVFASASTGAISIIQAEIRESLKTLGIISSRGLRRRCDAAFSSEQMLTAACSILSQMQARVEQLENLVDRLSETTAPDDCAAGALDDVDTIDLRSELAG